MEEMTPKERVDAVLSGKPFDRIPCALNVGVHAAKLLGYRLPEYALSADKQVAGIVNAYREYGVESVGPHANLLGVLGLKYAFPEESTPYVVEPLLNDYADLERLEVPDFRNAPKLKVFWETLERVTEEIGDEVPVTIGLSGTFSAAAQLRGIQSFLRDLYRNPEFAHRLLSFVLECNAAFVREAGKFGVRFGIYNPTASGSLISPQQYRAFAFPYDRDLVAAMKEAGDSHPMLHICGNTAGIWQDMADTGAGILSLDNIIDMAAAKVAVGDRVAIMGNVRPTETMLLGTPGDVEANVRECVAQAADTPKGYLMALGCGLPLHTPPENIHALVAANKKHGSGNRSVAPG